MSVGLKVAESKSGAVQSQRAGRIAAIRVAWFAQEVTALIRWIETDNLFAVGNDQSFDAQHAGLSSRQHELTDEGQKKKPDGLAT